MTPDERLAAFWAAVDRAEDEFGVLMGVYVDEEGEPEPSAVALEDWINPKELH